MGAGGPSSTGTVLTAPAMIEWQAWRVTLEQSGRPSSLPTPADAEVHLLLQTVWDLLTREDHWPSYRSVDRLLYREQRLDVAEVIARTPETLFLGGRPVGAAPPDPDGQLSLTAAGAAACAGSDTALRIFLAAVRLAAEAELQSIPDGQDPTVTFEEASAAAGLQPDEDAAAGLARRSGLLLSVEPWTGHLLLYQGGWKATVDRRARIYSGVADLNAYWRLREQQRGAPTAQDGPSARALSTGDGGARVVQLDRRWTIGDPLGSGGFGQVFRATCEDGILAAAKFVPKVPGAARELLFAELSGVRNVVPVVDSGEVDDAWVLVMPLAERSLQDHLDDAGPLSVDEAREVLRDIAVALVDLAARDVPVVHRDLKPGNVLLFDGAWYLADFGISRYAEASTAPDTRKLALSPPYAAPERWWAERATSATDVYAVGVIAYELLTGSRPFAGPHLEDYREQHLNDDPPPLDGAPPRLAALVTQCLQKAPAARPSAARLAERLERAGRLDESPGAAALAAAYERQAGHEAAQVAAASRARTEEQRRAGLATAANRSLEAISEELLRVVIDAAPAQVERRKEVKWIVELGAARFSLSAATPFDGLAWGNWDRPPFDVVAFATITIVIPTDQYGYEGRSHSLYYCDAEQAGSYSWYETAFMVMPLVRKDQRQGRQDPFALPPGEAAAKALWSGMAEYQVAWPFTELVVEDLGEFVDRWVGWFAAAVEGRLTRPNQMPERRTEGSWRR